MKKPTQINVHQAKTELSRLLQQVEKGAEVIIARNGKPVARLIPFPKSSTERFRVGNWKGRIHMSPDFDAPLSERELKEWGG